MAKVFATVLENGQVKLKTWSSAAQFEKTESWIDEKFIFIATSKDFKGDWAVSASFEFDLPKQEENSQSGFAIKYSAEQRKAHQLMCEARRKYLRL